VQIVGWARHELGHKVEIERTRLFGLRMDEEPTAPDVVRKLKQPGDHVLEEGRANTPTLVLASYPEAGEQRDRLRVATRALA
jgi:hypothetical protein